MKRFAVLLVTLMALCAPAHAQFSPGGGASSNFCLNLNFAASIPTGVTFTGPNNATYYNSTGVLTTSATNTARYDYDPEALTLRGFLYEPLLSRNVLANSTGTGTGYSAFDLTMTAAAATGPDNTTSATSMIETSATGYHYQIISPTAYGVPQVIAASVFVKNVSGTRLFDLQLYDNGTTGGVHITVNPVNGVIFTYPTLLGTGWQSPQGSVQNVGNGWFRVTVVAITGNAPTSYGLYVSLMQANGTASYAGDGASGVDIYGLDLDYSNKFLSNSFIASPSAATTRNPDNASFTVPTGCNQLTATFDDNSTQTWIVPNGTYNLPMLNRPWLKSITGVPYTNPVAPPTLATAAGFNTVTLYDTFSNLNGIDIQQTNLPGFKWYTTQAPFLSIYPWGSANSVQKFDFSTAGSPSALNMANPTVYQDNILSIGWLGQPLITNGIIGQRFVGGQLFRPGMYMKVIASIDPSLVVTPTGDPALWMSDMRSQFMNMDGSASADTGVGCEIDLYEPVSNGSLGNPSKQGAIVEWLNGNPGSINQYYQTYSGTFNASFHTWELVWQTQAQNGTNGILSMYYDSSFQWSLTYTSTGGSSPAPNSGSTQHNGVFSHCDDPQAQMVIQMHSAVDSQNMKIQQVLVVQ